MARVVIPDAVRDAEARALRALWDQRQQPQLSQGEFGKRFGIGSEGMVWQYLSNHRPLNMRAASGFARGLGVPIDSFSPRLAAAARLAHDSTAAGPRLSIAEPTPNWVSNHPLSQAPQGAGGNTPQAHHMSLGLPTIEPPIHLWEQLLINPPTSDFRLEVPDDSMRLDDPPSMRRGDWAYFRPATEASAGQVVLIADRQNNLYIRKYIARTPGHWMAVARHPGFEALDNVRDGLRVLAVQFGGTWG